MCRGLWGAVYSMVPLFLWVGCSGSGGRVVQVVVCRVGGCPEGLVFQLGHGHTRESLVGAGARLWAEVHDLVVSTLPHSPATITT